MVEYVPLVIVTLLVLLILAAAALAGRVMSSDGAGTESEHLSPDASDEASSGLEDVSDALTGATTVVRPAQEPWPIRLPVVGAAAILALSMMLILGVWLVEARALGNAGEFVATLTAAALILGLAALVRTGALTSPVEDKPSDADPTTIVRTPNTDDADGTAPAI